MPAAAQGSSPLIFWPPGQGSWALNCPARCSREVAAPALPSAGRSPSDSQLQITRRNRMKSGARNQVIAVVKNIKRDKVMSQVDLEVAAKSKMGSVMTTDSLDELGLKKGDKVILVVKAVNVLLVQEGK